MKTYVTFGQQHTHRVNGITFDCDCVAVVEGDRDRVVELFGLVFCFTYTSKQWKPENIKHFPRGYIEVQ